MKDPIVEEIRQARDAHAKQFNYDLDAICDDLRKREKESGVPTIALPLKRLERRPRPSRDIPDTIAFRLCR